MKNNFRKKLSCCLSAACLGIGLTFSALPAPTAEADILGTLIYGGLQYAQMDMAIDYYNNDPEGRNELFSELKSQYGVNEDPILNERLNSIMSSLTSAIATVDPSINKKPYNYFINTDETFNAFCSLGHNMSVNTGLFSLLDRDDEIAVVLGHEMGHGQKNHAVSGFQKSIPYSVLAQIFVDSQGGTFASALGATIFANYATATQVTKPQEWEADNLAFTYIIHSGYNPGACAALWQRVMEKQGEQSQNFVGEIFSPSDHPTNKQRRDNYEKKLEEYSLGKVTVEDCTIKINKKEFLKTAASDTTSAAERAYLIAGNVAAVYHNNATIPEAYIEGDIVMLGEQPVMVPISQTEPSAEELVNRLNTIK